MNTEEALKASQEENAVLRRLLAFAYSGAKLYYDDGELQDSSQLPFIDFKRDKVQAIEEAMRQRTRSTLSQLENIELDGNDALLKRFMKVE